MTRLTVVVATRNTVSGLQRVLRSLEGQTLPREHYEVVVVDDGSSDATASFCRSWQDGTFRRYEHQNQCGAASARNLGLFVAASPVVLFLDDDEVAGRELLEEHVRAHTAFPEPTSAIVGCTSWSSEVPWCPVMDFLVEVDRLPFGYPGNPFDLEPDFTYFRSRQLSVKRSFLAHNEIFSSALDGFADIELGYRLRRHGLSLRYWSHARSARISTVSFDALCDQLVAEGPSIARLAEIHRGHYMREVCRIDAAVANWQRVATSYEAWRTEARDEERSVEAGPTDHDPTSVDRLWRLYHRALWSSRDCGIAQAVELRDHAATSVPNVNPSHRLSGARYRPR